MDDEEIAQVAAACSWRELEASEDLAWPGDSAFALYTVTRGRLRVHRHKRGEQEDFIGYVNQGDTVGQAALLAERLEEEQHIVADIRSQVAVIARGQAMRLFLAVPRFRQNVIGAFGVRFEKFLEGKPTRRNLKVAGVVATDKHCHSFLPELCEQLERGREKLAVMTERPEAFARLKATQISPMPDDEDGLRTAIRKLLTEVDRVLIDVGLTLDDEFDAVKRTVMFLMSECDELLWCLRDDFAEHACIHLLERMLEEHPNWRSRIVGVRMIEGKSVVGKACYACGSLVQRDFVLPLDRSDTRPISLWQQGMDRIVRHLRGVKIGLAFGGGGARGLAHLGVLKTLEAAGISFDLFSGTSAGAMVGIGYAAGIPADDLISSFAEELRPAKWLDRLPGGRRLYLFAKFQARAFDKMLRKYYSEWTFEQLPIPFSVVVTDLVSGDEYIRNSGDVVEAILESINVPLLSNPLMKDGRILVDGGVLNNLPAELLSDQGAEFVIGVDASKEIPSTFAGNRAGMHTAEMKKPGRFETAQRVMDVSRRGIARLQMTFADLVIEPDTSAFDFADFAAAPAIAEQGVAATQKMLPRIKAAYDQLMQATPKIEEEAHV